MSACREIYRVEQLPIFQNRMFGTSEEAVACQKGNIILVQDARTGMVFNQAFHPELMQYDSDYQNEQACSSFFRGHLDEVTAIIHRHLEGKTLIEVGCGKGHFFEHLQASGFKITGLDPAYEGTNTRIIKEVFNPKLDLHADGIILRHVLEHIPDPVGFLFNICETNRRRGKIYIEVPCFEWIMMHRAWFDIFYEHVNYFRLSDFKRMFRCIHEAGYFFGGQYMYVVADIATLQTPQYKESCRLYFPSDFLGNIKAFTDTLTARSMRKSAIWGGASKGVIFALFMQRANTPIDLIIDINPAKQGKYIAGSGLRVESPGKALELLMPGADIFVMNSNYLPEIMEMSGKQYNYIEVDHEVI